MNPAMTETRSAGRTGPFRTRDNGPARTRMGRVKEFWAGVITNNSLGTAVGYFASKAIALPQLRRLEIGEIRWAPLGKSLSDSTVVLISTGGVHLRSDPPFNRTVV